MVEQIADDEIDTDGVVLANSERRGHAKVDGDLRWRAPKPAALSSVYGAGAPLSFEVFYRLRPAPLIGQDTSH